MPQEVGTTKSRTSCPVMYLYHGMLFLKKVSHIVLQRVWGSKYHCLTTTLFNLNSPILFLPPHQPLIKSTTLIKLSLTTLLISLPPIKSTIKLLPPLNHTSPNKCPSHPGQVSIQRNIRNVKVMGGMRDRTGLPMGDAQKDQSP